MYLVFLWEWSMLMEASTYNNFKWRQEELIFFFMQMTVSKARRTPPIPRSCIKSFSSLIVSGPFHLSVTARCRCSRCKPSLCSPFEPLLQESKALRSKVCAISQFWILTERMEPYRLYFLVGKQSQTKHCLSLLLGNILSKMKCLEDFSCPLFSILSKISHFWKSHIVFSVSGFGAVWSFGFVLFFFPPSSDFQLQSTVYLHVARGIHHLFKIHLQELVCVWFETCEHWQWISVFVCSRVKTLDYQYCEPCNPFKPLVF